jgi:hypothetical protein
VRPPSRLRPDLAELLHALRSSPVGAQLVSRMALLDLDDGVPVPPITDLRRDLAGIQWFLDRAADGGIPLTAAGYLKPVEVERAAAVLPGAAGWPGKTNREDQTAPVLRLGTALQRMRLLRKHRGHLVLTPAGRAAQADHQVLWEHLRVQLVTGDVGSVEVQGRLLALLLVATGETERTSELVSQALTRLGWREAGGHPISVGTSTWFVSDVRTVLDNLGGSPEWEASGAPWERPLSPTALALARAALRAWAQEGAGGA